MKDQGARGKFHIVHN